MGISFFQLLVILLIVLVLFGRGKLPALAEDLGKSVKAFRKGIEDAKKNMITVSLKGTTIPHQVTGVFGAGRVLLKPAAPGTGIIAGSKVRMVLEAAGIKNIRAKCLRSNNPVNVVRATMEGLKELRSANDVAKVRDLSVDDVKGGASR